MPSLKSFLPVMAPILHTTADALYSRQRALVRLGLFESVSGKGPGSGVLLTADSLAVLLIALMGADTLAETDERIVRLCNAFPDAMQFDDTQKFFRKAESFRDGVAEVLFHGQWTKGYYIKSIKVSRYHGQLTLMEGTGSKRLMKTKTFRIIEGENRAPYSPIVKTTEIGITGTLEMASLINSFHIAAGIEHDGNRP